MEDDPLSPIDVILFELLRSMLGVRMPHTDTAPTSKATNSLRMRARNNWGITQCRRSRATDSQLLSMHSLPQLQLQFRNGRRRRYRMERFTTTMSGLVLRNGTNLQGCRKDSVMLCDEQWNNPLTWIIVTQVYNPGESSTEKTP
jgi:hypothetical protein